MRVMLITKNFPPRSCGVGDYACRLAEELAAAGDSVTVLTEQAEAPRPSQVGLRKISLRGWQDLNPVMQEIGEAAPDRVQLEYSSYAWNRWGTAWWVNVLLFRLRRRGTPAQVGLHELAIRMRQHPLQVPVALAQWAHIGMLLGAAETVAINMPSRIRLLGRVFPWWRRKLRYRPNPSNIPVVSLPEAERIARRREHGAGSGEAVIATFGMFHEAKRYETLIGAVARLRRTRRVKLWMLGDVGRAQQEYIVRLKTMVRECGIEDDVWWPGRLEPAEVSRALQAADLFVLPQPDGHLTRSGAFMAAAAHGLPVVAVRDPTGKDQEEFTHGENVWLVEHSTPEEIAAPLGTLLADRAAAGRLGRNLQALYESRFDWRVTVARPAALGRSLEPSGARNFGTQGEDTVTAAHANGVKP